MVESCYRGRHSTAALSHDLLARAGPLPADTGFVQPESRESCRMVGLDSAVVAVHSAGAYLVDAYPVGAYPVDA